MTPQPVSFCQVCGADVPAGSKYCQKCGSPGVSGEVNPEKITGAAVTNSDRLRQLLDQANAIEPSRRDVWLAEACQGDAVLLAELRGMMTARYDTFMAQTPPPPSPNSASPQFIGAYRMLRELGRGGMGVVYLAVRDDGTFRKNVALKLLLRDQVNEAFVQRFIQERQVLAALDHPNIARILDGGNAPDGMPYYVMEYVEGLPLDQYCDDQHLSLTGRLKLFQQVCQAVDYLHQNSILHRDLKPSNILVSSEGVVKLLDFGIAKVMSIVSFSPGLTTKHGGSPMTPIYASPEQIMGAPLQKTSDIYSLGAILYGLITGRSPYQGVDDKVAKIVTRQEPPKPSSNIREDLRAAENTAQLRRAVMGELDSIVLMSMRLAPIERYQSCSDFAADLQRFIDGERVLAHHASADKRLITLLKLKPAAIAALMGFLFLGGFGAWQWRRFAVRKGLVVAREVGSSVPALRHAPVVGVQDAPKVFGQPNPPSPSVPEATVGLPNAFGGRIGVKSLLKLLDAVHDRNISPGALRLTLEGSGKSPPPFPVGERFRVNVSSSQDCFYALLHYSSDGSFSTLAPNLGGQTTQKLFDGVTETLIVHATPPGGQQEFILMSVESPIDLKSVLSGPPEAYGQFLSATIFPYLASGK